MHTTTEEERAASKKAFAVRLRALARSKGKSYEDIADVLRESDFACEYVRITGTVVGRWIRGEVDIRARHLPAWLNAIGCSVAEAGRFILANGGEV